MVNGTSFETAREMLDGVRAARINMLVFAHDSQVPSEVAAPSRLMWRHVPELARRMDPSIELMPDEGYPENIRAADKDLMVSIARDLSSSREIADWLAPVTTAQTKAIFAKGSDNALDAILEKHAKAEGFSREDVLAQEAGRAPAEHRRASPAIVAGVMSQLSRG